jgi:hypothetical protein
MYGIVNKSIENLVIEKFGQQTWEEIKIKSGVEVDFFMSNEPYPDDITFKIVGAISEVTKLSAHDILVTFGHYWILKTGAEKYAGLMQSGGDNLREFLINLPAFHNRVMLIYPKLQPPEFKVDNIQPRSIDVLYYSHREGLQPFVLGLLQGLGLMYKTEVEVILKDGKHSGLSHDIFNVSW